ncbi:MAG TPA: co-chaperone GroES [Patescibacteria group bacterium]|nr:co-chaperone GroES [Patescibacteria group bacterium]
MLKPLFDQVLIEPEEKEQKTSSGIIIPDSAKEKPSQGKVVAVGPGLTTDGKTVEIPVKPGDTVIYKKWGGHEVKEGGKDLLLVEAKDIMAIVKETK